MGLPIECHSIQTKLSSLEIDSDDVAIYIARTKTTSIEVHLDYFGRQPIRRLELFLPNDTICCDILKGTVSFLKTRQTETFHFERNEYQMKEIEHFFAIVDGQIGNDSDVSHALQVLRIAKGEYL